MPLTDLVAQNAIIPNLKVNGKKQALSEIATKAAEITGQNDRAILENLLQREKLGSTGVGNGVAIPHGKLPKLGRVFGLFARLDRPIDFDALDGQQVDLIFLLLAPEGAGADHLKALARVARLLRDPEVARKLAIPVLYPVMHMKRVMFTTGNRPFELVETYYRADKYHYSVNLVRVKRKGKWTWRTQVETSA